MAVSWPRAQAGGVARVGGVSGAVLGALGWVAVIRLGPPGGGPPGGGPPGGAVAAARRVPQAGAAGGGGP
eukprot:9415225-Pyramimonas_sp.AAC.1